MNERTGLGGNNPPDDQRIDMLTPAEDIDSIVSADVKELTKRADELLATCSRVPETIEDQATYDKVVALIAGIRQMDADREDRRKKIKEPYLKAGQAVDAAFKLLNDEKKERSKLLEAKIKDLTGRLSVFDTAEYQKQQEEAQKEAAALSEQASKDGITIPSAEVQVKLESRKSEHGGTSTRNVVREWTVTDEDALPRSVLMVDPKKVQELVDQGAKIPGIAVTERVETVVKRS